MTANEIELPRGYKISESGGIWAAYDPRCSVSGHYKPDGKGHWYAAGSRVAAEAMVRVWMQCEDADWSDRTWECQ